MIKEMKQIPVTENSHPFASAVFHCKLEELGYVEEEYFMSGMANVYREGEYQKPEVIFPDAPYTTRLLIRRPARTEAFSGNVVIEDLNASAMMDIDRMWVNSWKYFTRNGDIYIGITSKGHVVDALKKFDPKRYKAINWSNPMPEREAPPQTGPFPFLSQYESGLFWDMLVDLAKLVRTDSKDTP
ncbi:MAG: alpha/beta hydrolase domain-containing protein, partial [Lachnospiraceae bacterium]|nr:alpha/beta hydrolase domain-containing protein [Lachnospiraceae bacterium]